MDDFLERLFDRNNADVVEEHMDEASVDEMHTGVLDASDIEIHLLVFVLGAQLRFILWVAIADEVKGAIDKGIEGIGFSIDRNRTTPFPLSRDAPIVEIGEPFALDVLGSLWIVYGIETSDEPILIIGDSEIPLFEFFLLDLGMATVAMVILDLFSG